MSPTRGQGCPQKAQAAPPHEEKRCGPRVSSRAPAWGQGRWRGRHGGASILGGADGESHCPRFQMEES